MEGLHDDEEYEVRKAKRLAFSAHLSTQEGEEGEEEEFEEEGEARRAAAAAARARGSC